MRRVFLASAAARRSMLASAWFMLFCAGSLALSLRRPNRPPPGTFARTTYSSRFRFHSSFGTTAKICGICRSRSGTSSMDAPSSHSASTAAHVFACTARMILRSTSARPPRVTRQAAAAETIVAASSPLSPRVV